MSYANFVRVKVVTPVTSGATSFAIEAAVAPQNLPPTDGGFLILCDSPGNPSWVEIIQYTSRSGLGISGVTRGVEGTTAVAWSGNVYAIQALTAGEANTIQTTLAGKQAQITAGTNAQYYRGDKTFVDFMTDVRAATLTGLSTATNAVITATDTVLSGLGKLQKQISDAATNLAANVRAVVLTGYVSGSNAALAATDTILGAFGKVQGQLDAKAPLASPSFTGVPLVPTAAPGTNTTQASSTAFVQTAIANLIASSPAALDTLNELATALGNDPNFATTMTNALAGKEPSIAADVVTKFWAGNKTWRDLSTDVRAIVLTGLSVATGTAVVAGDSILVAIGKLQKQCTDRLLLSGGTMTGAILEAPIATLASASTVDLSTAAANSVQVTGTTTINSFGTSPSGVRKLVMFSGSLTVANSANLTLPGGANYTTLSGDMMLLVSLGAGAWSCHHVYCVDGQPVRPVNVAHGGTGGTDQASARTGLGLGNAATLNAASGSTPNSVVQRDASNNFIANVVTFNTALLNVSIELGNTAGSASTPFIDFHSGATVVDYDARIISDTPTGAVGGGALRYYANGGHIFTGAVQSSGTLNGLGGTYSNGSLCWSASNFNPNTKLGGSADGNPGILGGYNRVYAPNYQSFTAANQVYNGAIEIREANLVGGGGPAPGHIYNAPGITFHWSAYAVAKLMINNAGNLCWGDPNGTYNQITVGGDINGTTWGGTLSAWLTANCLTLANWRTRFADLRCGELGSFAMAAMGVAGSVAMNNGIVGTSLLACNAAAGNAGQTLPGNWYCAGYIGAQSQVTLFQRYV